MNITYLVHGFPPFENAGTEQHTALLAKEMAATGHRATVISATRQPGQLHGTVISERWNGITVHRIVNNIPALPLSSLERRPEIERIIATLIPETTDILHIQHTQFLSSKIPFDGPMIWTLHDAWGWCPAGGTLLHNQTQLCRRQNSVDCVKCYATWMPQIPKSGQLLMKVAQRIAPIVPPRKLHHLWQRLPDKIRIPMSKEMSPTALESEESVHNRNHEFRQLSKRCTIVSPSKFLQTLALTQGWQSIQNIPHGLPKNKFWNSHIGGHGLLFVGSMVHHKGPHLVSRAYQKAFPTESVPIVFVGKGPITVPHRHISEVSNDKVYELLRHADALVMGSVWHENYPIILLEAKAVGCPVIAPDCGGIPEIVESEIDGILYEMGNENELAEAMVAILQKEWSPKPPLSSNEMRQQYLSIYRSSILRRNI